MKDQLRLADQLGKIKDVGTRAVFSALLIAAPWLESRAQEAGDDKLTPEEYAQLCDITEFGVDRFHVNGQPSALTMEVGDKEGDFDLVCKLATRASRFSVVDADGNVVDVIYENGVPEVNPGEATYTPDGVGIRRIVAESAAHGDPNWQYSVKHQKRVLVRPSAEQVGKGIEGTIDSAAQEGSTFLQNRLQDIQEGAQDIWNFFRQTQAPRE